MGEERPGPDEVERVIERDVVCLQRGVDGLGTEDARAEVDARTIQIARRQSCLGKRRLQDAKHAAVP